MACSWFLQLLSLGLILYTDRCAVAARECNSPAWFGLPCRYKCHCANNNCDKNGECTANSTCVKGWFGPACQYVDLVATNTTTSTPGWVYDSPDVLCNTGLDTVTVSLNGTFYFTWLRLRANVAVSPQDFTLQLMDAYGISVRCGILYTTSVSDTLLDIHCQQGAFFQNLTITGAGVKWLCSVMVSGGRNVALGQNTTQTSNLRNSPDSSRAVDGNRNSDYDYWSCTHTYYNDTKPTWTLTFERSYHVNRYTLYNRDDLQQRLRGFILEAAQKNRSVAFSYTDHTNTNHAIYRIPSNAPLIPVSSVKITATYTDTNYWAIFLTLCEVEMFGDTVCPAGYYGRDCEKRCNCAKRGDSCFVSTGGCPSGCAAGYHWEACQYPCNKTCSQKCSTNCTNQLCQPTNGTCLSCPRGKQGPMCDNDCNPTFWGDTCATQCRFDCKNHQSCNAVTGTCISCVAGKSGENCDQACSKKYFGVNCLQKCSTNCAGELCEATNGTCLSCIPGKQGPLCDKACNKTYFGVNCLQKCSTNCTDELCEATCGTCLSCIPGKQGSLCDEALPVQGPDAVVVGLVIAFVAENTLIIIGVLIWRRRRHTMDETGQTTPHRYHTYSKADGVRTLELNTVTTKPDTSVTDQENSPDHPYEIPNSSTAQPQKERQLKSEDHVTYANDTPNDSFDDTMANTYMDINDV